MSDVTELIATHDRLQTRKDGGVRSIASGLLAKRLRDALEAEHAEVERLRAEADADWPCDGGCNVNDGPDEMCSRHGRRVSEVWRMEQEALQRAERAEAENARLTAQLQAAQEASDDHMQKLAHRVMDVFGNADEDALAEEIMQDVFAAIGLTEAFGAAILDAATDEHSNHEFCDTRLGCVLGATDGSK